MRTDRDALTSQPFNTHRPRGAKLVRSLPAAPLIADRNLRAARICFMLDLPLPCDLPEAVRNLVWDPIVLHDGPPIEARRVPAVS
jgi:hypothetical protein